MRNLLFSHVILLLAGMLFATSGFVFGKTIYVNSTCGNHEFSGESDNCDAPEFSGPKRSIGDALTFAESGDIVIVADGIYNVFVDESPQGHSNWNGLHIPDGVTLRSANGAANCIIDSGPDKRAFLFGEWQGGTLATVLDGFTIRNVSDNNNDVIGCYNGSWPTITNCIFTNNEVLWRGNVIYCSDSSPTISDCVFSYNSCTDEDGSSVIYIINNSSPTLTDCEFSNNSSSSVGGAIYCSDSNPTLNDCVFSSNSGDSDGGAISFVDGSLATLTNCAFNNNETGERGGAISCIASSPQLIDCTFSGNSSGLDGGAIICDQGAGPVIDNCRFVSNRSSDDVYAIGGAIACFDSSPAITHCDFNSNSSMGQNADTTSSGGAIGCVNSSPNISHCFFNGNSADYLGGAIRCYDDSNAVISDCYIVNNIADNGGGINCSLYSNAIISNCFISSNIALSNRGGGIVVSNCNPEISSCTISMNISMGDGGGISSYGSPVLSDCIITGNSAKNFGGGVSSLFGFPTLINCDISGNVAFNSGGSALGGGVSLKSTNASIKDCAIDNNASVEGGGVYIGDDSSANLIDSSVSSNEAEAGAAVKSQDSSLSVTKCRINDNVGSNKSGGILTANSTVILSNTVIAGNYLSSPLITNGSALRCDYGVVTVSNCTFADNRSDGGGSTVSFNDMFGAVILRNSILWNNTVEEIKFDGSFLSVSYCDIEMNDPSLSYPGMGNINVDPLFASIAGFEDEVYVPGDYHLKSKGGRFYDPTQSWIIDDVKSPCIDAGDPLASFSMEPVPNGNRVNIGAYGTTDKASKAAFCSGAIEGDISGDCKVDISDLSILAKNWLNCNVVPASECW